MKKYLSLLFMVMMAIVSCQKFDDSKIWDKLNDHETRIAYLEEVCKNMNTSIVNLQTVVTALETNDYIVSASPLVTGDGYTFLFKSGKSIVIYNGKDGQNGTNGSTPVISVRQDTDGYYYWTVDGEWLIVDGEKVKAAATDGENGVNGITPKFKIEEDYWYVSYDNGQTWKKLGKATGNNGLNGVDGDTLFNRVYIEDGYVCFELNDETKTVIRIPLVSDEALTITLEKKGTLSKILTLKQIRETTHLVLKGNVCDDDMRTVQIMNNLQLLDVRDATYEGSFCLNPCRDSLLNRSIIEVWLPKSTNTSYVNLSYCFALRKVVSSSDYDNFSGLEYSPLLEEIEYAEGVTLVNTNYNKLDKITYPSTLTSIPPCLTDDVPSRYYKYDGLNGQHYYYSNSLKCKELVCKAVTPPMFDENKYYYSTSMKCCCLSEGLGTIRRYYELSVPTDAILYVPRESIELYRTAPLWEKFTNILPLESLGN